MDKVTVADVAKRLRKDPQVVRIYIQHGLYPFAVACKLPGSTQYDYTIFPEKFAEYCGNGGKPDISKLKEVETDAD